MATKKPSYRLGQLARRVKVFMMHYKLLTVVILGAVLFSGIALAKKLNNQSDEIRYVTEEIVQNTLTTTVSGVGQVSVSEQVDLKPNVSGSVTTVYVSKGDYVEKGDRLINLDSRSAERAVENAEVDLETAQIDLDELLAGTDALTLLQAENDVAEAERAVEKAQIAYDSVEEDAEETLADAYLDGYVDVSNAFFSLSDYMQDLKNVLGTDQSSTAYIGGYKLVLSENSPLIAKLLSYYDLAQISYQETFDFFGTVTRSSDHDVIYKLISDTHDTAEVVSNALESARHVYDAIEVQAYSELSIASVVDTMTPRIESDISGVFSLVTSLENTLETIDETILNTPGDIKDAKLALSSAQENLEQEKQDLADIKAGIDPLDIRTQRNLVAQREADLAEARSDLSDHFIRAPFSGVIADVGVSRGETVSTGTTLLTILSDQQIAEIALNEIDAVQVEVGQKATISFDAVEDLTITGEVVSIDPLGTVSQGVVTYDVAVAFDTQDERIKPGMSMSVSIITNARVGVLVVPNSAVQYQGASAFVQVLNGATPERVSVEVGLSNDTHTEIVNGLSAGDQVVTQTIAPSTGNSTSSQTQNNSILSPGGGGSGGFQGARPF